MSDETIQVDQGLSLHFTLPRIPVFDDIKIQKQWDAYTSQILELEAEASKVRRQRIKLLRVRPKCQWHSIDVSEARQAADEQS